MEDMTYVYKILIEKPERKRQIWRIRHRCNANIKMDLKNGMWVSNSHLAWSADR
jgi:hypothetical protein